MALRMRMARGGNKNNPFYRIVVAENTAPRDGKFVEKIGTYNPLLSHEDKNRVVLDVERVKYWLSKGVKPSDRIAKFLGQAKIIDMPTFTAKPVKGAPKAKAQERVKAAEAAVEAAKQAAEDAKEAAKAAAAAPKVEEPAAEAPAEAAPEAPAAEAAPEAEAAPAEEPQA